MISRSAVQKTVLPCLLRERPWEFGAFPWHTGEQMCAAEKA